MQHIFISYKHEDLDFADNVISRLEKEGFITWADAKIGAGEEWRTSIDLAIKNSFSLIVIMTPEAKASEYVTYEWAFTWGIGIRVIPIMLRPTRLHPRLEALQYLDFTNTQSRPWGRLVEELREASRAPLSYSVSIPINSPPFIRNAVASLDSANLGDRKGAIETLKMAGTPAAYTVLKEALKHPLMDVRGLAAAALGRIGDAAAVPALIEILSGDSEIQVRNSAAIALGEIGDAAAVPALTEILSGDSEIQVRNSAAIALGRIGDAAAVPALTEALENSRESILESMATALGNIGDAAAVPTLIKLLENPSTRLVLRTVAALGKIGDPAAVPALQELRDSSRPSPVTLGARDLTMAAENALSRISRKTGQYNTCLASGQMLMTLTLKRQGIWPHPRPHM